MKPASAKPAKKFPSPPGPWKSYAVYLETIIDSQIQELQEHEQTIQELQEQLRNFESVPHLHAR